jgi:F-box interacting protein
MPLKTPNRGVCTFVFESTFDMISEVGIPFDFACQIVGSCNGLLCLASTNSDNAVFLWNPSVRKFKVLPDTCLGELGDDTLLGFAYHSENNDYKVVRISFSYSSVSVHEIEVYTLSSDSWRRIGISSKTDIMFYNNLQLPTPLVNGALHWKAIVEKGEGRRRRSEKIIMSFDVNRERFKKVAVPHGSMDANFDQTCLALFRGKLAFITFEHSQRRGCYRYSIWVMRKYGVFESWHKLIVVPFQRIAICYALTEYGSLLIRCRSNVQGEKQKLKYVLIDAETLHEKDPDIQVHSSVATFMESLVLLDGANVVSY